MSRSLARLGRRPRLLSMIAGAMLLAGSGTAAVGQASAQGPEPPYSAQAGWGGELSLGNEFAGVGGGFVTVTCYAPGTTEPNAILPGRDSRATGCARGAVVPGVGEGSSFEAEGPPPTGTVTIEVDAAAQRTLGIHSATIATLPLTGEPESFNCGFTKIPWRFPKGVKAKLEADYKKAVKRGSRARNPLEVKGSYKVALTFPVTETIGASLKIAIAPNPEPVLSPGHLPIFSYTSNFTAPRGVGVPGCR